jgi:septum formation protein
MNLRAPLILASTSRYRAELLERLRISFSIERPEVDETAHVNEAPPALALRLAQEKARAISDKFPHAIVIGADQVAERAGIAVGKPGARDRAIADLSQSAGQNVDFHSAVCVRFGAEIHVFVHLTRCQFRTLTQAEIEHYIDAESPLDCAGSIKCEGLGISLLERMESDDPTGVIGLPLIQLARVLRGFQRT